MALSVKEAYELLELPLGADKESLQNSYKKLANRWHPAKHKNSAQAILKFEQINNAFRKLTVKQTNSRIMTMTDMISQYEKYCVQPVTNGFHASNSSSDDETDSLSRNKANGMRHTPNNNNNTCDNDDTAKTIHDDDLDRLKKAEKRKAKKKKRKEKKRAEKESKCKNTDQKLNTAELSDSSGLSDQEDLDPNSAFVAIAASKNKKITCNVIKKNKQDKDHNKIDGADDEQQNMEQISPIVLQSRQLAIRGNEMANVGQYQAAVGLFAEAIKLDPRDYRFFGNRSYCYDRLVQYDKALRDAESAIHLSSVWPKGYFRKGRALSGLKLYSDAEQAFEQVLKLDKNCEDAVQELLRVRTYQLTDMGFSKNMAEAAIRKFGTVQAALDSLLAGVVAESSSINEDIYICDSQDEDDDDDDSEDDDFAPPNIARLQLADDKMNPRNPDGLTSLWVGNVAADVTDKMLTTMFKKYGSVTSVRVLSEKHCAFVNFKDKISAGRAMECLQGKDCLGEKLLVRFPDNPITNGQTTITKLKKPSSTPTPIQSKMSQSQQIQQQMLVQQQKQTGPVNGDECYFWRTTGCIYGDKCRFRHIKEHKGIDKKPWQKPSV